MKTFDMTAEELEFCKAAFLSNYSNTPSIPAWDIEQMWHSQSADHHRQVWSQCLARHRGEIKLARFVHLMERCGNNLQQTFAQAAITNAERWEE